MKLKISAANTNPIISDCQGFISHNMTYHIWPASWRIKLADYLQQLKNNC